MVVCSSRANSRGWWVQSTDDLTSEMVPIVPIYFERVTLEAGINILMVRVGYLQ